MTVAAICTVPSCEKPVVGRGYCTKHYQRVRKHGDPNVKFEYWPAPMRWRLSGMLARGYSDRRIGRELGRSASAVKKARLRFGFKARYRQAHTAREISRIMGVHHMKPQQWIGEGRLQARKNGARYGRIRVYQITHAALLDFIEDPDHWHCWDPEAITDDSLQTYARRVRADDDNVWLTMKEATRITGYGYTKVWNAIDRGELPAKRDGGNCLLIEQADLAAWYVERSGP